MFLQYCSWASPPDSAGMAPARQRGRRPHDFRQQAGSAVLGCEGGRE